jgi:hypothetical protein
MEPESGLQNTSAALAGSQIPHVPVIVNFEVCRKVAGLLRSQTIPLDREDSSLPWMSPKEVGNFYLLLVALCHQTSPRGRPPLEGIINGRHLRGWDYLSGKFEAAARANVQLLSPDSWGCVTGEDLRGIFHDPIFGDCLSDPEGRASLIRDIGQKMLQHSWDCADRLFDASLGRIAGENMNLLDLLAQFRAYDDPVRKKSFFFLALMHNTGLWTYADPEELGAPVDYHEVRGHLRLGTVEVCDPDLHAKLIAGTAVTAEQDIAIRQAVFNALMFISQSSGLRNPSQLHYLFWNVFRSCCSRENTHCHSCPPDCPLPERYVPMASFSGGQRRCPFSTVCQSAGREPKMLEHVFETDYY